jgi:pyruvate dehydrogenase E1 component alpha subunit
MFDHVYVDEHPLVEQERAEFAQYLESFADAGHEGGH